MADKDFQEHKDIVMSIKELLKHSDKRDDIVETKLDEIKEEQKEIKEEQEKINDFLRNGLSDKIVTAIITYFDKILAEKVRWIFRVFFPIVLTAVIGIAIKLIFF